MDEKKQLSRRTYKFIKGMDRAALSAYVSKVYLTGFEAGRKAATPDVLFRAIRETLLSTEGIGEIRADAIMEKLAGLIIPKESAGTPTETTGKSEKATPIRPNYEGDGYDENGNMIYDIAHCPKCEHTFEEGVNDWGSAYCPDCGQRLDWSPYPEEINDNE